MIAMITGNIDWAGDFIVLCFLGVSALFATVVGAVLWGIVRAVRNRSR